MKHAPLYALALLLALPDFAGAARSKAPKAKPQAIAEAPAPRTREDVAVDFYGLALKVENGQRLCAAREAGNSQGLQDIANAMQQLPAAYELGKKLYSEGRRTPDTRTLDAELAADNKRWAEMDADGVDSACMLLGLSTIMSTQTMSDELNQFAPTPQQPQPEPTPSAAEK